MLEAYSQVSLSIEIVREFRDGLSMQEIAAKRKMPVLQVEQAIRRWMNLHVEVW